MLQHVVTGFVLGFTWAAPIGPTGLLCLQASIVGGFRSGFAAGLGAATVHALYGGAALAGASMLDGLSAGESPLVRAAAAVLLFWLSARLLTPGKPSKPGRSAPTQGFPCYAAGALITLLNPFTALYFAATVPAVAGAGGAAGGPLVLLPLGIFAGSACWWLTLSGLVSGVRLRFPTGSIRRINRASGIGLLVMGLLLIV